MTWDWHAFTASYAANYLGPLNRSNEDHPLDYAYERIPEFVTHDIRLEYRLSQQIPYLHMLKNVSVYGGVDNFTNAEPPYNPATYTGTGTASLYGPIGRFYFMGVAGRF